MLRPMWFFFFFVSVLIFWSSRNVPSWIWLHGPASSLSWASPELGGAVPERDRGGTSTPRSVPPSLSLPPLFTSPSPSVCVSAPVTSHLSRLRLNHFESRHQKKKREGCRCLIGCTSKPLRINNHPPNSVSPNSVHSRFIFSHVTDFSWKLSHMRRVLSSVKMSRRVWVTCLAVQPHSPAVGGFFVLRIPAAVSCRASNDQHRLPRITSANDDVGGRSVCSQICSVSNSCLTLAIPLLFFNFFFPQATPRQPRQLALRITIPAIHTTSTCPW